MININTHSTYVELSELPHEVQLLVKETDLYKEYDSFELKYLKYPDNTPIVFSSLEYDFEMYSGVESTHNLQRIESIICFASAISLYEKVNVDEKSYALFRLQEYGYDERHLIVIEI